MFFRAVLLGVSQFIFVDTVTGGVFVLLALAVASRPGCLAAYVGATIALITSWWCLQVPNTSAMANGLYGYNAAGACAAVVCVSESKWPRWKVWLLAVGASVSVVFMQVFVQAVIGPGLPVCTLPFVLTSWLYLGGLHNHHRVDNYGEIQ